MIILHVGKIGVGKSYSCTREVWDWLNQGVDVYCNWQIDFNSYMAYTEKGYHWFVRYKNNKRKYGRLYYFDKLSDIYGIRDGQIYIDEAHHWLNARTYLLTPPAFITKMSQSRHYKTDLHFICQYPGQIESVVRNLTNLCIKHTKFWRFMWYKEFDGEFIDKINDSDKKPKSKFGGFKFYNKHFAKTYDTFAIIGEVPQPWDYPPVWTRDSYLEIWKKVSGVPTIQLSSAPTIPLPTIKTINKISNGLKITVRSV